MAIATPRARRARPGPERGRSGGVAQAPYLSDSAAMGDGDRLPALPLTACVLAGPIPAALVPALFANADQEGFLRTWGTLVLIGLLYAAVIGVPLALWALRDPAAPWRRWIGIGIVAGLLTTIAALAWTALTGAHHLIEGQWGAFQVILLWIVVPLVLLSAIVSRILLGLWLRRTSRA